MRSPLLVSHRIDHLPSDQRPLQLHRDVKEPDGKLVRWMIEGGSPNQLIRLGVTKNTLAVGTELVVEGYLAREGANKGVARNFTLLDGRRLFLGGSAPPEAPAAGVK